MMEIDAQDSSTSVPPKGNLRDKSSQTSDSVDPPSRTQAHNPSESSSAFPTSFQTETPEVPPPPPVSNEPRLSQLSEDLFSTPTATCSLPSTPVRQTFTRKRLLEPPPSTTQLDLFGESLPAAPAPRRRAVTTTPEWKKRVVCGDANLTSFSHEDCVVLAHERGRLSHFSDYLRSISVPSNNVEAFVISLTLLDKGNNFLTNKTSLKAVLGAAGRLFPKAKRIVMLCGIPDTLNSSEKTNIQELNNHVMLKAPSSCLHIPAPIPFEIEGNSWTASTRTAAFQSLRNFLN